MIGIGGFFEELSFVLIPIFLLLVVFRAILKSPKVTSEISFKGIVALVVVALLPTFTTWKFVKEVRSHVFFSSLTPKKVLSLSIGSQQITDRNSKILLVEALRGIQWFSSHHGGWAQPVQCRIQLTSGEERYFQVALYLREPGAVIDFGPPEGRAGIHPGYAFSETLPSTLKEVGIDLRP